MTTRHPISIFFPRSINLFFFAVIILSLPLICHAADSVLVLDPAKDSYSLPLHSSLLIDKTGPLTIEQITAPHANLTFVPVTSRTLDVIDTSAPSWLKFHLDVPPDQPPVSWVLNPGCLLPGEFTLFTPVSGMDSSVTWKANTIRSPIIKTFLDKKSLEKPFFVLPESMITGTAFYLKINSLTPQGMPLTIIKQEQNTDNANRKIAFVNFIYGALLALAIFHFCLYLSLKDTSALFFVCYLVCNCLFTYSLNNLTFFGLLEKDQMVLYQQITVFLGSLSLVSYTMFSRAFLGLSQLFPRLDKAVCGFALIIGGVAAVTAMGVDPMITGLVMELLMLMSSFVYIGIGFAAWHKGFHPAAYYLISTLFPCMAMIFFLLPIGSVPFDYPWVTAFFDMSFSLEGILLSLALAARIRRLRAEQEFAQGASLAKSQFLASMSHEIRTPMNAIMGMAELLHESPLNREQQKYVQVFQAAGENLLDLIDDILDLSKIESGQIELRHEDINLREIVERACEILALNAHGKKLELLCHIQSDVPEFVNGDPVRLRQVLINLLGNAIKFTHEGEVILNVQVNKSTRTGTELLFCVKDTGIGIPKHQQEQIFDHFTQADHSITRSYGGTGLGLAISRRIAGLMTGRMWVESEPGKGSCFYFTATFKPGIRPAVKKKAPMNPGIRTLVIDDNETNRMILREYLLSWGAVVQEAASGPEALDVIKMADAENNPFHLILLDSRMPEMDGIETAGQMERNNGVLKHTVIMLTSDESSIEIQRASDAGIHAYLVKPVKQTELRNAIQEALADRTSTLYETQPADDVSTEIRAKNILVVEDARENQFVIKAYLKKDPCVIQTAENGLVALEMFKHGNWDLVLMDVEMPVMDGLTATKKLRKWEKAHQKTPTPVIALTAHALKEDRQKCLDAGCDEYLSKPIKKAKLREAIRRFEKS